MLYNCSVVKIVSFHLHFFFAVLWDCYTYCTGHFFPKLVTNSILWNDSAKQDSDHSSDLGPRQLSRSQENPKHNWKIWKALFVSETFFFVVYFLLRVPFFFFFFFSSHNLLWVFYRVNWFWLSNAYFLWQCPHKRTCWTMGSRILYEG